jgi:hypothetical protein
LGASSPDWRFINDRRLEWIIKKHRSLMNSRERCFAV